MIYNSIEMHPTQVLTPETARPVLKAADGSIILDSHQFSDSPFTEMQVRHCGPDCKLQWGPRCRAMKRRPKGKENISLVCKCGASYIEYVPL